jgi:hypothetical protein
VQYKKETSVWRKIKHVFPIFAEIHSGVMEQRWSHTTLRSMMVIQDTGQWSMVNGQWSMVNVKWSTDNDQREMVNGQR